MLEVREEPLYRWNCHVRFTILFALEPSSRADGWRYLDSTFYGCPDPPAEP
jgi:hypothetical protein